MMYCCKHDSCPVDLADLAGALALYVTQAEGKGLCMGFMYETFLLQCSIDSTKYCCYSNHSIR